MFLQKPMLGTQIDRSDSLNNPVLDLLMNEGHGDRVNDLSGWGNHGTLHGFDFPPTRTSGWNPGMDGACLTFDMSDDIVTVLNSQSLNITDAITVDMVIKETIVGVSGANRGILKKGTEQDNILRDKEGEYFRFAMSDIDNNYAYVNSTTVPKANVEYRLTGTIENGVVSIYVNGILERANDYGAFTIKTGTSDLTIGLVYTDEYFKGSIARARILSRAYSPFEVMQTQINPYGMYLQ